MKRYLRANATPPAKVTQDGPLGERDLERAQMTRVRSERNQKTGLAGNPPRYYDQNLAMFALGSQERQFWFDPEGALLVHWKRN